MPLDFNIPLRAFDNQFDPAKAQAQALSLKSMMDDSAYKAETIANSREDRKLAAQKRTTLASLLPKATQGDRSAIDALAGVDVELFAKMDTRQREQVKERADFLGNAAMLISREPDQARAAAAWDAAIEAGLQRGYTDLAEYRGRYNPQALPGLIATSGAVKTYLDQQNNDRDFGFKTTTDARDFAFNAGKARDESARGWASVQTARYNATKPPQVKPPSLTDQINLAKFQDEQREKQQSRSGAVASMDTAIGTLNRLTGHPGMSTAVGAKGVSGGLLGGWVPSGTDAAGFLAELEAFKSQMFLPMVQQLKGMGALSNAEGSKLTAAVGALDPSMPEAEFRASAARIMGDLEAAKVRAGGGMPAAATPGLLARPKPDAKVTPQQRLKNKYGLE